MALSSRKITTYAKNIADLADRPIESGFTAATLKAFFDGSKNEEIKTSINGIVDDLLATADGTSGADQTGSTALKEGGSESVQGQLEELKSQADGLETSKVSVVTYQEQIINAGNSNSEIVDARGGETTLGTRLNNTDAVIALKATKTELNTEINAVASGAPKGVYATLVALEAAFPTGDTNIYLVTADGKWYYWNSSVWTVGGVYQASSLPAANTTLADTGELFTAENVEDALAETAEIVSTIKAGTGIDNGAIIPAKTSFIDAYTTPNKLNPDEIMANTYIASTTGTDINSYSTLASYNLSGIIPVTAGETVYFIYPSADTKQHITAYSAAGLQVAHGDMTTVDNILWQWTIPAGTATQVRIKISSTVALAKFKASMFCSQTDYNGYIEAYGTFYTMEEAIKINRLEDVVIESATNKADVALLSPDIRKLYVPTNVYALLSSEVKLPYKSIAYAFDSESIHFYSTPSATKGWGKCLKDKWMGDVALTGVIADTIYLHDSKTDAKIAEKVFNICSVNPATKANPVAQKNVLILGDSFIQNEVIPDEIKLALNTTYGFTNFNFIGEYTTIEGTKHQGQGGYQAIDFLSNPADMRVGYDHNPFWNSATEAIDIPNYVTVTCGVASLDYVIMHLGVNDFLSAFDIATALTNVTNLISAIKSAYPSCKIFVDGLIPLSDINANYNSVMYNKYVFDYNDSLETAILALTNTKYVPIASVFDADYGYAYQMVALYRTSTELEKALTDWLHPYEAGYCMIADQIIACFLYNM